MAFWGGSVGPFPTRINIQNSLVAYNGHNIMISRVSDMLKPHLKVSLSGTNSAVGIVLIRQAPEAKIEVVVLFVCAMVDRMLRTVGFLTR